MQDVNCHTQTATAETATKQLQLVHAPILEDIQEWLAAQIEIQLGVDSDEIDIQAPFSSYGLTSIQATSITILGTQMFGLPLSPLTLWNFPNIASLSQFLVEELAASDVERLEI